MRLALLLAIAALLAGLAAGCGGSSSSTGTGTGSEGAPSGAEASACGGGVRVTGVPCDAAQTVLAAWRSAPGCRLAPGASHAACKVAGGYLCIAARQGEKAAVSCAQPGRAILFVPPR
jgi:hypothetical protein